MENKQHRQKAVFFDRDGTLNVDIHYLHRPQDFIWTEDARAAIKYCNDRGYLVIIVTNQSGVARGYYSEADVRFLYDWMNEELTKEGAHLDALYYCPHHPEGRVPAYTMSLNLTALILAKNEEKNIAACIKSVLFAGEVVVIDDFSTDRTAEIAVSLGARVVQHGGHLLWPQAHYQQPRGAEL